MSEPFHLFETMRWEASPDDARPSGTEAIALWPRHRARLARSAEALGIPFDGDRVDRALAEGVAALVDRTESVFAVRMRLGQDGVPEVSTARFADGALRTAMIWSSRVDPGDPRFRHKTTRRDPYERALAYARAHGDDEAILVNTRGEVTEGSYTNVWVEHDGRLLTPRVAQTGGLPGVMRAHLLATRPDTAEAVLTPEDLLRAGSVYLSNALRGLVRLRRVRR